MRSEKHPESNWSANRIAALGLTLVLSALAIYLWIAGVGDKRVLRLLFIGVVLGIIYVIRGGSLPAWLHGPRITADDDLRNISPKIYLPVLLVVILLAAALFWVFYPKR